MDRCYSRIKVGTSLGERGRYTSAVSLREQYNTDACSIAVIPLHIVACLSVLAIAFRGALSDALWMILGIDGQCHPPVGNVHRDVHKI